MDKSELLFVFPALFLRFVLPDKMFSSALAGKINFRTNLVKDFISTTPFNVVFSKTPTRTFAPNPYMLGNIIARCGFPSTVSLVFHILCARMRSVAVDHHSLPPNCVTTRSNTNPPSFLMYDGNAGRFKNRCSMCTCCDRANPEGI